MNTTDIFGGQKLEILNAFLVSEAKSYFRYTNASELLPTYNYEDLKLNENGEEFVGQLKQKVADEIVKLCPNGFNWCTFNSLGNAGALELQIVIYGKGKFYNWQAPNIHITLCTCGNINCWGSITVEEKTK